SLRDNFIESIYLDSAGVLWIGTQDGWLERYERSIDGFTHFRVSSHVYAILGLDDGSLWLGSKAPGLIRFDPASGTVETIWEAEDVTSICQDAEGRIWAASTEDGLWRNDPNTGTTDILYPEFTVHKLTCAGDGRIWMATWGGGLGIFDPSTGSISFLHSDTADSDSPSSDYTSSLHLDVDGYLWVGTYQNGMSRYDLEQRIFTHYAHDPSDPYSLAHGYATAILRDRSGILWIGGGVGGGLSKLGVGAERFGHYRPLPNDPNSLSASLVTSIAGVDDILWVGTFSGLDRWDRTSGEWRNYQEDPAEPTSLTNSTVRSVYVDRGGTLWVGTEGGLDRFDPASDGFVHYGGPVVMWMHEGPSGRFWLATKDGFYEKVDDQLVRIAEGWAWKIMVLEDSQGIVWVGTSGDGLERFDPLSGTWQYFKHDPEVPTSLSHDFVEAIIEEPAGMIWAATGDGLNRYNAATRSFNHYTIADGLADDRIGGLLADDTGMLWLATNGGLSRLDPRSGQIDNYTTRDGIQSMIFWRNSYFKGSDGELFFGGDNGFNAFFPENITRNNVIPPLVISAVSVDNEIIRTDLTDGESISFSHTENYLSFDYAVLDYADPSQNQTAYQMVGLDLDWVQAGNRHHADYPNLSPGTYTFRVIGSNNDGVWNEVGASVEIRIRPPFWQTGWFIGLAIAMTLAAAYGGYRWRVNTLEARGHELEALVGERTTELTEANLRLEEEMLERQRVEQALAEQAAEAAVIEERNRLARDLHDSVTQSIYSSTLLAEAGRRSADDTEKVRGTFRRLGEITRHALKEMRLLVYELRPLELEQAGLIGALQARLDAVERRAGVDARLIVQEDFTTAGEGEEALYFIAQEALNNALKHTEPTLVEIRFDVGDDGAHILTVRDDGQGFDPTVDKGGLGLNNMQERAAALGGSVEIQSTVGEGTQIRVTIPRGGG
ncbi:MAG: two-component regulator propeller domain-containing protein, partial [Anaerolineales bacterium]